MSKSIFSLVVILFSPLSAEAFTLSANQLRDVQKIAQAIHVLQPGMQESKYMEYAVGIFKASRRYRIEPHLLVSIAHTETAFREDLPEGKAGELGVCQILKSWIKNPYFISEFGRTKEKDFLKPEKSFLFAAWILSDLKENRQSHSIPYWSYYNAVRFEPRLRYFLAVNKRLSKLQNKEMFVVPISEERLVPLRADAIREVRQQTQQPRRWIQKKESGGGWIANALRKLQEDQRKNQNNPFAPAEASLVNVAADLAVEESILKPVVD